MESFELLAGGIVESTLPASQSQTVTFTVEVDVSLVDGPKRGELVKRFMRDFGNELVCIEMQPCEPWLLTFNFEVPESRDYPVPEGTIVFDFKRTRSPEFVRSMVEETAESFRFKWPQPAVES